MKNLQLQSLIFGKYNSVSECARKMGWSRQRLHNILNGKKIPNLSEANQLSSALECSVERIAQCF